MTAKMSQNDFFVAIQGVMSQAHEAGWSIDQTHNDALDAVEEWLEEIEAIDRKALEERGS